MTFDITLHGVLLWASTGFLMPIGVITIRMCNREECGRKVRVIFYVHTTLQVILSFLFTSVTQSMNSQPFFFSEKKEEEIVRQV